MLRYFSLSPEVTVGSSIALPLQRALDYEVFNNRFGHGYATGTQVREG